MMNTTTNNDWEKMVDIKFDSTFLPVVATSFTLFVILYKFINPMVSRLISKEYEALNHARKIDWSTR